MLGIVAVDQASKWLVAKYVPLETTVDIIKGCFRIWHVRNSGAIWGFFQGHNNKLIPVVITALAIIALLIVAYFFLRTPGRQPPGVDRIRIHPGRGAGQYHRPPAPGFRGRFSGRLHQIPALAYIQLRRQLHHHRRAAAGLVHLEGQMHPILIKLGPLTIASYGFLFALGVLLAILLAFSKAKKENIDLKVFADFIFYVMILSLLGAKLWLLVTNLDYYLKYPAEIKYLLTSGGAFYGGLIFGAVFAVWFIRRHALSYRQLGDIAGPSLALGHFFGRLGCFAAGCCWGREAGHFPLAVTFSNLKANSLTGVPLYIPLYPTQLFEAMLNFANFLILMVVYKKRKFQGQVFALYILNYSLIRFTVEYFRGDPDRGYVFGGMEKPLASLSVPQLICLIGFITALVLLKSFKKKGEKEHHVQG